ncbi:MAG TPA: hypothetical protein VFS88_09075 [Micavibrio sp.]|nr:hypothetical protein [Micavibrio sp.]
MSNRTFAAQPSLVKPSSEGNRQAERQFMAVSLSRSLGEAPYDYGSNRIADYLKLTDNDLRCASEAANLCSRVGLFGAFAASTGTLVSLGTLALSFNQAAVAATVTAGLGVAAFASAMYKSRQLEKGINAHIQQFDNA